MKTIKITLLLIGFFGLAFIIVVKLNLYPAAFTIKWFIANSQFERIVASSLTYYKKTVSVYASSTLPDDINFQKEIRRAALDKLIEDRIVDETLTKKLGKKELDRLVSDKLASLYLNGEVANASQLFYNLSLKDFKNLVLKPQAEKEILDKQGINLQEIKKSYHPIILVPGFYWQDEVLAQN